MGRIRFISSVSLLTYRNFYHFFNAFHDLPSELQSDCVTPFEGRVLADMTIYISYALRFTTFIYSMPIPASPAVRAPLYVLQSL